MVKSSLIDLSSFGKVACKLIDKISNAIGWVITHDTPNRIAVKTYIEDIQNSNLSPLQKAIVISRAKKDIKEYANQHMIVNECFKFLTDTARPENVEDGWIAYFLDKARLISDEDFQLIWSRLLAEECNKSGSVSKNLLSILERMEKIDAELFLRLCNVSISVFNEAAPLISDFDNEKLKDIQLSYDNLVHMEAIGLIKISSGDYESAYELINEDDDNANTVSYYDHVYELPKTMNSLPVGNILFTKDGLALYKSIEAIEIEDFWKNKALPWIEKQVEGHKMTINCDTDN